MFSVAFILKVLDHSFKRFMIFAWILLHAHHNVAVHLKETAIGVPGETRVARALRHDFDDFIVHSQV